MDLIEYMRLQMQEDTDAEKSLAERNKLGQYATPTSLAEEIIFYAQELLPKRSKVSFLDPAFGMGAFYSALLKIFSPSQIAGAAGYEIDVRYGGQAAKLWSHERLTLNISDFTLAIPPTSNTNKANLLICNPPYVRHHHIPREEKKRLQLLVYQSTGISLSGLSGLYCYFLCLGHEWMADNAIAGWLIPSEFMDVNYGKQVKEYLLNNVTLLSIHRFDPLTVQFKNALVSSAIVWFKKSPPPKNHEVRFSFGGTLGEPTYTRRIPVHILRNNPKWTQFPNAFGVSSSANNQIRLGDLFSIKRGLATGANSYFVLSPEQIEQHKVPAQFLVPLLPGPRDLQLDEIEADEQGYPILDTQLYLLSCNLPEDEVPITIPTSLEVSKSWSRNGSK